jgi:hypothetical protein
MVSWTTLQMRLTRFCKFDHLYERLTFANNVQPLGSE